MTEMNVGLTQRIIGCAIEVHKQLGPGLLESAYQSAMCIEFGFSRINCERERSIPIEYRGVRVGDYRPDLIVENKVVVEIKSALAERRDRALCVVTTLVMAFAGVACDAGLMERPATMSFWRSDGTHCSGRFIRPEPAFEMIEPKAGASELLDTRFLCGSVTLWPVRGWPTSASDRSHPATRRQRS